MKIFIHNQECIQTNNHESLYLLKPVWWLSAEGNLCLESLPVCWLQLWPTRNIFLKIRIKILYIIKYSLIKRQKTEKLNFSLVYILSERANYDRDLNCFNRLFLDLIIMLFLIILGNFWGFFQSHGTGINLYHVSNQ